MNSRERVMTALDHHEPDTVPLDLNGTLVTALTRTAYNSLLAYLDMPPDPSPVISSREMDTVRAREDLLRHYRVDTRCIHLRSPLLSKGRDLPDGTYYDDFGIRWKKASYYYDAIERPLASATVSDLASAPWPDPCDPGRYDGLGAIAQKMFERTPYCLVADIPGLGPFEGACFVRGHDRFCVDLCMDTAFADALLDKMTDFIIAVWDRFLAQVGPYVQVAAQGDDVGMQGGPFISPELYRRFIKPRHKRIFDFIHSRTGAKVFYHSCGSVYDLIPDFIEEGVDIINPVQRSAAGMDIIRLKREFGEDITFWGGGIDVQQELPFFSLDKIRDEIRRTIDILAPGGGFIFFASHNIQADVSPQQTDAMFQAVLANRAYAAGVALQR